MSRLRLSLAIVVACLVSSVTFAELFSTKPPETDQQEQNVGAPSPVMAPDNFQSKVKSKGEQAQRNTLQQSQASVQQQSSQITLPNAAPPPLNPNNSAPATPPQATNNPSSSVQNPPAATETEQQPAPQPAPLPPQPTMQPNTTMQSAPPATAPAPAQPSQGQVYTGFGAGSQNNGTTGNSSTSQSGGWSVKY